MNKDVAEETQDKGQDKAGKQSSDSSEKQSSIELSKEQEAEVTKRVSDKLAAKGDETKTLEGRVKTLESENQKLNESALTRTADKYGLTLEEVKKMGIDDSDRLDEFAKLFGKEKKPGVLTEEPDGGEGSGGGTAFKDLSPNKKVARSLEKLKNK